MGSMAIEEEKQTAAKPFDEEAASAVVKELRASFVSGKTRSYQWRVSQFKCILNLITKNEREIVDALRSDLSKPELESQVYEEESKKWVEWITGLINGERDRLWIPFVQSSSSNNPDS